jgi:hypothetical protein
MEKWRNGKTVTPTRLSFSTLVFPLYFFPFSLQPVACSLSSYAFALGRADTSAYQRARLVWSG